VLEREALADAAEVVSEVGDHGATLGTDLCLDSTRSQRFRAATASDLRRAK
jgi:hypothetical protein